MQVQKLAGRLAHTTCVGVIFHNEDIYRRYVCDAGHLVFVEILLLGKAVFKSYFMYGGCSKGHHDITMAPSICALIMFGFTYKPQSITAHTW